MRAVGLVLLLHEHPGSLISHHLGKSSSHTFSSAWSREGFAEGKMLLITSTGEEGTEEVVLPVCLAVMFWAEGLSSR